MGLFAHMPPSGVAARPSAHPDDPRSASALLSLASEARPHDAATVQAALDAQGVSAGELGRIYAFLDEAQVRSVHTEQMLEQQKEANRRLLIGTSQQLIDVQGTVDALGHEAERLAAQLAAVTAQNRAMVASRLTAGAHQAAAQMRPTGPRDTSSSGASLLPVPHVPVRACSGPAVGDCGSHELIRTATSPPAESTSPTSNASTTTTQPAPTHEAETKLDEQLSQ